MKSQVPRRCPAHKYCGIRCSYRTTLHAPVLLELPSVFSTRVESDQSDHLSTDRAILLPYPSLDLPESRPDKSRVDTVLDRIVPSPRPRRLPAVLCLAFSCSRSLVPMRIRSKRHEAIRKPKRRRPHRQNLSISRPPILVSLRTSILRSPSTRSPDSLLPKNALVRATKVFGRAESLRLLHFFARTEIVLPVHYWKHLGRIGNDMERMRDATSTSVIPRFSNRTSLLPELMRLFLEVPTWL